MAVQGREMEVYWLLEQVQPIVREVSRVAWECSKKNRTGRADKQVHECVGIVPSIFLRHKGI